MDIKRANTILYCRNWESTVRFYGEVLDFRVTHRTDWFVEFRITADAYLSVADADRTTVASAGGRGITLSWRVQDVEGAHRKICGRGIETSPIKTVWGSRAFYFSDPEGHRIEIWSD